MRAGMLFSVGGASGVKRGGVNEASGVNGVSGVDGAPGVKGGGANGAAGVLPPDPVVFVCVVPHQVRVLYS